MKQKLIPLPYKLQHMNCADICPHCSASHGTQYRNAEVEGKLITQCGSCSICGANWHDVYIMTEVVFDGMDDEKRESNPSKEI